MPDSQAIAERVVFPPQPWRLRGELRVSAWLIPARDLAIEPPTGWRPLSIFGRRLVGAAFAHYAVNGDLAYSELAAALAVRRGWRLGVTVPWIWVDDPRALAGGRQLWAIPKLLARFRSSDGRREAGDEAGHPIAAAQHRRRRFRLPGRWRAALTIVQPAPDGPVLTPLQLAARLVLVRAAWRAGGPLAVLNGRRPLISLRLERARLQVGRRDARI
jgi:hypothetical protein